jgi:short-subunit dehydrogenase
MGFLKGKVVFITGASSGIGRALAVEFARQGCDLFLTARNEAELLHTVSLCKDFGTNIYTELLDVSNTNDIIPCVDKALLQCGHVDILVNNAGISQRSLVVETPLEIDRKVMEVNYFGTIALTKALLPNFNRIQKGNIIVISSMTGLFGFSYRSAYAASKHALHGFFETLQIEQPIKNLYTTIICPGRIQTNISLSAITANGQPHGEMDPGQAHGIPADECARKIIRAMQKRKPVYIISREEKWLYYIKKISRSWFLRMARKVKAK